MAATAAWLAASVAASPCTTGESGSEPRRASHLPASRSRTPTAAPAWTNASTTARPMPEPPPTTSARRPASSAIAVLGAERMAQEGGEQVVVLPRQRLELDRVEQDLPLEPGRGDAQPLPVPRRDQLDDHRGELVRQLEAGPVRHRKIARFCVRST